MNSGNRMPLTPELSEDLVQVLSGTLNEEDIALYLGLATGDDLYDEYVGRGLPKNKTLRTL